MTELGSLNILVQIFVHIFVHIASQGKSGLEWGHRSHLFGETEDSAPAAHPNCHRIREVVQFG